MNQSFCQLSLPAIAVAATVAFGLCVDRQVMAQDQLGLTLPQSRRDAATLDRAEALSALFRRASEEVIPTVVKVRGQSRPTPVMRGQRGGNPFQGTPFEDMFGNQFDFFDPRQSQPAQGMGSGVIIDPSGVILTNNHVVADFDEVNVELHDGRQFDASIIGTDPKTDLALLKIEAGGALPAATMGDSDALQIGDWVLAIGNPFDYDATVSAGIVSAKGRELQDAQLRAQFLQTDAAINPGNSGGPLVNLRGEIVGINTAIASRSGGFQGIGFAIPINLAKWVTGQLRESGQVRRGYLGIAIQALTAELSESLGFATGTRGVLVTTVNPDTPAADAGLVAGDVIVGFDGQPVRSAAELQRAVEKVAPGQGTHTVDLIHDGEMTRRTVRTAELPHDADNDAPRRSGADEQDRPGAERSLGIEVDDLTPEIAEGLGYDGRAGGIVVVDVTPGGSAAEAGLRRGTIIVRWGNEAITSVSQFRRLLQDHPHGKRVALLIRDPRYGNRYVTITP